LSTGRYAQEHALLTQCRQLAVHGFGAEAEDAADLGGIEGFPVEDELVVRSSWRKSGSREGATGADRGGETVEDGHGLREGDAGVGDAAACRPKHPCPSNPDGLRRDGFRSSRRR